MISLSFQRTFNLRVVSSQVDDEVDDGTGVEVTGAGVDAIGAGVTCVLGTGVEVAGAGVEATGEGVKATGGDVVGEAPVKRSDFVQRSLRNVFLLGSTVVRSFSLETPNHWAIPFHKDSQGLEGITIPGSKANGPTFVTAR